MAAFQLDGEEIKSVEEARELSLQARARGEAAWSSLGFLSYMSQAGQLVAPWWSRKRDRDLDDFCKKSDHLSGARAMLVAKVVTVPVRVAPRDASVKAHLRQAEDFTIRLVEESDFGGTWITTLSKWLIDYWSSDGGGYLEIIGGGKKDGPIVGAAAGVAHLDSLRCVRTGDPEYPILYRATDGSLSKFHWTRVAFASDMPSPRAEMKGVGFCAVSRCINVAQNLVDISAYKQEKLGSRPLRAILQSRGVDADVVTAAISIANESMDNSGLTRFARIPVVEMPADAELRLLSLSSLPEGFDEETSTRLGMFALALAFGVPIRWIWPAATTGATKADAMYQHIAGLGGGIGKVLRVITTLLGGDPRGSRHMRGKFLPPHLKLVFDFQDDEQDRMRAEVQERRAKARTADLGAGVINVRVAREQALEAGDLTRAQFEQMELAEGRLPGGEDITTLFYAGDEQARELLDLGVPDPLDVARNDREAVLATLEEKMSEARDFLSGATTASSKTLARQALAALAKLHDVYSKFKSAQVEAAESEAEEPAKKPEEEKGLLDKVRDRLKQRTPVEPRGEPLPPFTKSTVSVSEEDIDSAIAEWDTRARRGKRGLLPKRAQNVLEAELATEEEEIEAERGLA